MKNYTFIMMVVALVFMSGQPEKLLRQAKIVDENSMVRGMSISLEEDEQLGAGAGGGWRDELVFPSKWFSEMTDRSLRIDAAGNPHIAYGDKYLYYARFDGVEWHYEIVDSTFGVGEFASLALDNGGFPHISYHDGSNKNLKYAFQDTSGWHIETVDNEEDAGRYNSLALDGGGIPHISYYSWDGNDGKLKYASMNENGWNIIFLDDGGLSSSIALDGEGYPHIIHSGVEDGLSYVRQDATGWHFESLGWGYNLSLFLDRSNFPHISYTKDGDLIYTHFDTAGWHNEIIDSEGNAGSNTSITLDLLGFPHISYFDHSPNYDLKYAYFDGVSWQVTVVESVEDAGWYASLALDAQGYPNISYYRRIDSYNAELKYANQDASGWHFQLVDKEGKNLEPSLSLDKDGHPHIGYAGYGEITYAFRDASGWHFETLERGDSPSMTLDGSGHPHFSYNSGRDLKYAYRDNTGWHIGKIDEGENPSLVLDSSGYPHISYGIGTDSRYAYLDNTGWHIEEVDIHGSLALDMDDYPHIVNRNWYAYRDVSGWHLEKVINCSDWGFLCGSSSFALDQENKPHIIIPMLDYYIHPWSLVYTHLDADNWRTLDLDNNYCQGVSIALDGSGNPHISYCLGDLKYAYQGLTGWEIQIPIYVRGGVDFTSLAIDHDEFPHIGYTIKGDLRYAYKTAYVDIYLPLVLR